MRTITFETKADYLAVLQLVESRTARAIHAYIKDMQNPEKGEQVTRWERIQYAARGIAPAERI